MPKNILEQKSQIEKFFGSKDKELSQSHSFHDKPGDIHAHHHLSSLVATTSMKIFRLSKHDFGRRLSQFTATLHPFLKFERSEGEVLAQHLETEEWEMYKRALMDDVFRKSARSKRLAVHNTYVGKHYQPPPPRELPHPPRVTRGHYHDEMLEYLQKRKAIRMEKTSNKVTREALAMLVSPLTKRILRGEEAGHSKKLKDLELDLHLEARDQYHASKKHKRVKHGDIHHHDPHAVAWRMEWEQPHPPIDARYRRLMKAYERRNLINHSIKRLRKVAKVAGEKDWLIGLKVKKAPKLKAAVKSMQAMLISTFSHNKDVVSDAFRAV